MKMMQLLIKLTSSLLQFFIIQMVIIGFKIDLCTCIEKVSDLNKGPGNPTSFH